MKTYNYTYVEKNDYFKVIITKLNDALYYKEVLIDNSVKPLIMQQGIRVTSTGYAVLRVLKGPPVAHLVLNHASNRITVVDHINGDRLDNRKGNLRVLTQRDNANNRTKNSRCNTGVVGIARRKNGNYEYFRASVSDRVTLVIGSKAKAQTKQYTRQFNINKLGEEEAMTQAKAWLEQKRLEFNYV